MDFLFAEAQSNGNQIWWVAALIPLSSVITGGITLWYQQRKQNRADALKEWQEIVKELKEKDATQETEIKELHKAHHKCELENADLKGEIRLMQSTLRRLQIATGDTPPASVIPGAIVADLDGNIKVATPALTLILHWMPNDLKGKNIEMIVPERLREQHRIGLKRIKDLGQPPWPEKTIITYALTKEGSEIPVAINLSSWQTQGGDWLLSAEIRPRQTTPAEMPKPQIPVTP